MSIHGPAHSQYSNIGVSNAPLQQRVVSCSPGMLLFMFTLLGFFIYFDRAVFSAALTKMKEAFHLSELKAGVCSSSYLVCYCLSCPVFAQLAKRQPPLRLCSVGMLVWAIAVVGSGLAVDFWTLLLARAVTGIGEASFLVMAAPFIDFVAPPSKKSAWLAYFYAAIPIGYAAGYIVTGMLIQHEVFGSKWTWRGCYFIEAVAVLPALVFFATIRGPSSLMDLTPAAQRNTRSGWAGFTHDLSALVHNKLYVLIVLGYAAQTFFVGAVALFGIEFLEKEFDMSSGKAGSVFGAITAITGLFGSALGGTILDFVKPKVQPDAPAGEDPTLPSYNTFANNSANNNNNTVEENIALVNQTSRATLENLFASHKVILVCSVVAAPVALAGFFVEILWLFVVLLGIGEFAAFMMIGPINSAIIWCVPIAVQPTAVAISTLSIHALGDALSPTVIGAISDAKGMRTALSVSAAMLFVSTFFFLLGTTMCSQALRQASASRVLLGDRT